MFCAGEFDDSGAKNLIGDWLQNHRTSQRLSAEDIGTAGRLVAEPKLQLIKSRI